MTLNRPTSKQLKGHFDALRATKSHALSETINIAAGNYGSGGVFAGAVEVYSSSWVGASNVFYIYLNADGDLILDGLSFPILCTKIARVVIQIGQIIEIIDERASINGVEDGYHVSFDDSNAFAAIGDNVQSAIESLDGYVYGMIDRLGVTLTRYKDLPLLSGVLNGGSSITQYSWSPAINLHKRADGVKSRILYTTSVPEDYVLGTDIVVKIFWSTPSAEVGNMNWRLEYRVLSSDTTEINSLLNTSNYIQPAPGVDNRLVDTDRNLLVSANFLNVESNLLIINLVREGNVLDTFDYDVRVHLIRLEYIGRGVV